MQPQIPDSAPMQPPQPRNQSEYLSNHGTDSIRHLCKLLTRHGQRGEPIVAQVQQTLQTRYQIPDPILRAVEAVRPIVKYQKSKARKGFYPIALYPKTAEGIALRWILQSASARKYTGGRPMIARGLIDEFDAILLGTSTVYARRFATHKNPN